jgi:hypothetical protein
MHVLGLQLRCYARPRPGARRRPAEIEMVNYLLNGYFFGRTRIQADTFSDIVDK